MKRLKKDKPDSLRAYEQAQLSLKELADGYIPYDLLLTSIRQVKTKFPMIVGGELLKYIGHEFYWRRNLGEPLILYGKNTWNEELKGRGIIELCGFKVPKVWIGAGRFKIDWPRRKEEEETQLLITLYLYSINSDDFDALVADYDATAAFMATLFLDEENAELFNQLADDRFDSLR
jgi:hypothetical protein